MVYCFLLFFFFFFKQKTAYEISACLVGSEMCIRDSHKSVYTVSFDTQELIQNSIRELDEKLDVAQVVIRKEYGEQADHLTSKEQLENGEGFRKTKTDQQTPETAPLGSVRYDLIGKLVEETGLTRASIATILQGMSPLKFAMFRNCLLYTSPSPRDRQKSRMPSSA